MKAIHKCDIWLFNIMQNISRLTELNLIFLFAIEMSLLLFWMMKYLKLVEMYFDFACLM